MRLSLNSPAGRLRAVVLAVTSDRCWRLDSTTIARAVVYDCVPMRRALLIAILTLLVTDASGLSSLLVPETCAIEASDSAPDGGCPAFCVRCTCACCVSSIVYAPPVVLTCELLLPVAVERDRTDRLPTGASLEILHVPKPLLT